MKTLWDRQFSRLSAMTFFRTTAGSKFKMAAGAANNYNASCISLPLSARSCSNVLQLIEFQHQLAISRAGNRQTNSSNSSFSVCHCLSVCMSVCPSPSTYNLYIFMYMICNQTMYVTYLCNHNHGRLLNCHCCKMVQHTSLFRSCSHVTNYI